MKHKNLHKSSLIQTDFKGESSVNNKITTEEDFADKQRAKGKTRLGKDFETIRSQWKSKAT